MNNIHQLKRIIDSRRCAMFKCKMRGLSSHGRPVVSLTNKLNRSYFPMKPGVVTPRRSVPSHILYPEYATTGLPAKTPDEIYTYDEEYYECIRKSAKLARKMLDFAMSLVRVGISTEEIDKIVHDEIIKNNAYPSPINYNGFPKAICTSINEVVCHGIPDSRLIQEGDIISIDVSLYLDGCHGDNCGTMIVGEGDENAKKLVATTKEALDAAISICKPGVCLTKIGQTIQDYAHARDFRVVHEFAGHGTGPYLHMLPLVYHFSNNYTCELSPGMVFTIEPILVEGSRKISIWKDGWSAFTLDGGRGAQFEHEVLITETGAEVLTLP